MTPSNEKPPPDREADERRLSTDELRRVIEEYIHDLRHIIQNFRKRLH